MRVDKLNLKLDLETLIEETTANFDLIDLQRCLEGSSSQKVEHFRQGEKHLHTAGELQ